MGGYREDEARLFSHGHIIAGGNKHKLQQGKCQLDIRKTIFMSRAKQAARRSCEISILGDGQNLTEYGPGQSDLAGPVLCGEVGPNDLQRSRPISKVTV